MSDEARYRAAEQRLWESLGATPTEHRLSLEHSRVHVRVQELGVGPPVVFIHGAMTSGVAWAGLAARLADVRCLLVDRPGTGLSDALATAPTSADDLAVFGDTFALDVLDAFGLESASLVASSFGGYLAFRAAAADPSRVLRILEFGWSVGAPPGRLPAIMRLTSRPPLDRLLAALPVNEAVARRMFRQIGLRQALDAGHISDQDVATYAALLRHTDTVANELLINRHVTSPRSGLTEGLLLPDPLLARIEMPVHFQWGAEDPFGGEDIARDFAARFPDAELEVLPAAGHAVWMDDVERAAATARRFLGGLAF